MSIAERFWRVDNLTSLEFEAFPKIPRLNRGMVITEKIDGTNACVAFNDDGTEMLCQSRNRAITPDADNAGFASWCHENRESLFNDLGPGRHFGEWWGRKIQRGYGLDDRRFSLFNTSRWYMNLGKGAEGGRLVRPFSTSNLGVVPLMYEGEFSNGVIREQVAFLRENGSQIAPGQPAEGVVVFLPAANQLFKVMCENDNIPKGAAA